MTEMNNKNLLSEDCEIGWKPNKMMLLTKPYSKFPPVCYHKGEKMVWTSRQHQEDFNQLFLYEQVWRLDEGCNLAVIPTDKYWILDLDTGKTEDEIGDNPEQQAAFDLLVKMALAHSHHIVKTPSGGYHCYLPPIPVVTKTHHLPCVDIQYKDVYCLAPLSVIEKDGVKKPYEIVKWREQSPRKTHKDGVNQSLVEAIERYILKGEKVKKSVLQEKIVDNEIVQEVISLNEEGVADELPAPFSEEEQRRCELTAFVANSFMNPKQHQQHYEIWANYTQGYATWRNLAHSLKCGYTQWLGTTEETAKEVFHYISQCNPKYFEFTGTNKTERQACDELWDNQKYEPEKAEISYRGFRRRVLEQDEWILNTLDCFTKFKSHHLTSELVKNWAKVRVRLAYKGKECEAYKINQKTQIWETSPGGIDLAYAKITKIWLKLRDCLTSEDKSFPIFIKPNKANKDKKNSTEMLWGEKHEMTECDWAKEFTFSQANDYQRFYLTLYFNNDKNTMENGNNSSSILKFLKAGLVDYDFQDTKNSIPHLFPLKDAFNINLKTGFLEPRLAEHYFTQTSPCSSREYTDAKNADDNWFSDKFVLPMVEGKKAENVDYAVKMLGSGLCGEQVHHILGLIQGGGRNGKSVLLEILSFALGKFYHKLPSGFWSGKTPDMDSPGGGHIAQCEGARMVVEDESKDDATINTLTVKMMSGGGDITARALHGNPRTFKATWTCLGVCNNLPKIDCVETSMKERLRIMKANTRFFDEGHPEYNPSNPYHAIGNKELIKTTKEKYMGSVLWCLTKGCIKYYSGSMTSDVPEDWVQDLNNYYSDKYPFNRFVKAVFLRKVGGHVPTSLFKDVWKYWVTSPQYEGEEKMEGVYKLNKSLINKKLTTEMGFKIQKLSVGGKRVEALTDFILTPDFEQMFGQGGGCEISDLDC